MISIERDEPRGEAPHRDALHRADASERTRRDVARMQRRESERHFWQSLSLLGSVGWPIALLSIGGAALGRVIDLRWGTGARVTFALLSLGVAMGSGLAWRAVKGKRP